MADAKIDFKVNYDTTGAEKNVKNLGTSLGKVAAIAATAFAVKGVVDYSKASVTAYKKQAEAEVKLETVTKQRMNATDAEIDSIKELAREQQKLGIIGDEVQLAGAQQVATFLDSTESVETLLPAMNNLLAQQKGVNATQEDSINIGNMVGKVMQGQVGALTRVGVTFSDAQSEILKFGTEEEKAATLAQVITDNVGDMNSELAKTDDGKIQQAKNALGDMQEELGSKLIPLQADFYNFLLEKGVPILSTIISFVADKLIPAFKMFGDWIKEHTPLVKVLASVFGVIASALIIYNVAMWLATAATTAFGAIMAIVTSPITLIVLAIAAIIAIVILLIKNWDKVKEVAINVWTAISDFFSNVWQTIKDLFKKGLDFLLGLFFKFSPLGIIIKNFDKIKTFFSEFLTNAKQWGKDLIQGFIDGIMAKFTALKNGLKNVAQTVKDFLGFTVPDKGPLSNFDLSGKHMMEGYAKGINQNRNLVENASSGVATSVAGCFNQSGSNTTVNVNNTGAADAINGASGISSKQVSLLAEQNSLLKQLLQKPVASFNDKMIYEANNSYTKSIGVAILGV